MPYRAVSRAGDEIAKDLKNVADASDRNYERQYQFRFSDFQSFGLKDQWRKLKKKPQKDYDVDPPSFNEIPEPMAQPYADASGQLDELRSTAGWTDAPTDVIHPLPRSQRDVDGIDGYHRR